ncbi:MULTISPECIES: Rho termination factor N-terminal domain-containing protein [Bacillus]|uniref:Rho termination factor N-terminal domain-containing protein n=1 Tax=Bacillus TaxID=1386 RepID=UPI0003AA1D43|nr:MULTISPECIES: Rho termination factor N-terminal domain-containing protein [Bacillus]MCM3046663.1 Rho termination factor N-terminal domain-containing protein [Bacillus altitudinis]MCY7691556.1 Rho termination factor N-terminal domain-containing protein [Bacillus altitudinis]MEC1805161.1 Rho termination factor N-terminal domain-containing protein [Bacillus altitudinis]WMT30000.1 Rho termination factor N-terminal domain-containing protein [Bacillus aerius]
MGATTFWLLEQELKRRAKIEENAQDDLSYEEMTVEQLKQEAKEKGIAGYYNMKRETLLEKLKG